MGAFFAGYGHTPSFDLLRLRYLGTTLHEYAWLGDYDWPTRWNDTIAHFLKARDWSELLSLPERRRE